MITHGKKGYRGWGRRDKKVENFMISEGRNVQLIIRRKNFFDSTNIFLGRSLNGLPPIKVVSIMFIIIFLSSESPARIANFIHFTFH